MFFPTTFFCNILSSLSLACFLCKSYTVSCPAEGLKRVLVCSGSCLPSDKQKTPSPFSKLQIGPTLEEIGGRGAWQPEILGGPTEWNASIQRRMGLLPMLGPPLQGDTSGCVKHPGDLDLGCSAILPGQ